MKGKFRSGPPVVMGMLLFTAFGAAAPARPLSRQLTPAEGKRWVEFYPAASSEVNPVDVTASSAAQCSLQVRLPGMFLVPRRVADGKTYSALVAPGAGTFEVGRPDLPVFGKLILVPNGTVPELEVAPGPPLVFKNLDVPPLQPPPMDFRDAPTPSFAKDAVTYSTASNYPGVFAHLEPVKVIRGQQSTIIWLYPYQYNPVTKVLSVYPDLAVTVRFQGKPRPLPSRLVSPGFEDVIRRIAINADEVFVCQEEAEKRRKTPTRSGSGSEGSCDYLIVTHPDFQSAADIFAAWKRKSGFRTHVATTADTGVTADEIKNYLQNAYDTWDPAPIYVLFIGDAEFIPVNYRTTHPYSGGLVGTDLYYATLDGSDYFPDISTGRLSLDTLSEAIKRVNDIIDYEQNPVGESSFYERAAICAYFQHAGGGYAERRFAQTSEDLAIFLSDPSYLGEYSVDRIYYTGSSVNPQYWSTSWFGGGPAGGPGDPIPSYLLKPGFAWDGDSADITEAVNEGRFLVTHRDHGSTSGWGSPSYQVSHVQALTNGSKLPVVWSVNCETGWFDDETGGSSPALCFSEAWERNASGGAAGIIAATRISYSGHNDRLFWGWIDAIWPDFLSSYSGSAPFEQPAYRMGDVLNYGKLYYATTYSDSTYRKIGFEMFHWFGDPGMRIRTILPPTLSVSHPAFIPYGIAVDVTVNVQKEGAGMEGAAVTISKSDAPADYRTATTEAGGTVTFEDFVSNSYGDYDLVVTAANTVPYQGTIDSQIGSAGFISLDAAFYSCSSVIGISVADADLRGEGTQEVAVVATGGDAEVVTLLETGPATGSFTGTIGIVFETVVEGDGILQAGDGETVSAVYDDEDDGSGHPATVEDTAVTDCQPPLFAGLSSATIGSDHVILTWPAASDPHGPITYVIYRDEAPGPPPGSPIGTTSALSYADYGVGPDQTYHYVVHARDVLGNEDENTVELAVTTPDERTIGTGIETWKYPLYAFYHDARTQVIYLADEVGSGGRIISLALNIETPPGQALNDWTIRMQHTPASVFLTPAWESSGWMTVYRSDETISETGWHTFNFSTPFDYNGSDNLMIDFSFNNDFYTSTGRCYCSQPGGIRSVYYYTDSGYGDPLTWSSPAVPAYSEEKVPNIKLTLDTSWVPPRYLVNEGFDGFHLGTRPEGWTFINCDQNSDTYILGGGYYGSALPSLKLDDYGDTVNTVAFTHPQALTFWFRGVGTDGASSLLVEESYGSAWHRLATLTNLPLLGETGGPYALNLDTTRVRFFYEQSSGEIAFDDVRITAGITPPPASTPTPSPHLPAATPTPSPPPTPPLPSPPIPTPTVVCCFLVSGKVTDSEGWGPVAGAAVRVVFPGGINPAFVPSVSFTGPDGTYQQDVCSCSPSGTIRAEVRQVDYLPASADREYVCWGEVTDLNVELTPAASFVRGRGDFDGDGTSDIAVFRGASGLWAVRGITRFAFGDEGDVPVSGDYDGDGTTDPAVFRPAAGLWAVRNFSRWYWGDFLDLPAHWDYDGDGCCEVALFRPASGLWTVRSLTRIYFGTKEDSPVPGDYGGEGMGDFALFRGGSGLWAIRGISRFYFGGRGDRAVPGDYDGAGVWKPGIFRPGGSLWVIRGVTRWYCGLSGDQPVPADYDGDDESEIGVFREISGLWAVFEITRVQFGALGDIPVTR